MNWTWLLESKSYQPDKGSVTERNLLSCHGEWQIWNVNLEQPTLAFFFYEFRLSASDKLYLVSKIPLVSLFCLLGNDCVMSCIWKVSEAESRSLNSCHIPKVQEGLVWGYSGDTRTILLISMDQSSLRSFTESRFCKIYIYLKIYQKSLILFNHISQQGNAN